MLESLNIPLPITDPTWIFFLVLTIILFAPMILERLHIPHIIGMILAGVAIGEYGFNILERDSSFELFGEVGLYYIMFLAGLEMDMEDFKQNRTKGIIFGVLSFAIRFGIGMWSCMELLGFGITTSILMGCMYASHTLISYPIISRYGLSKLRCVNITIGGTIIVDTLALIGLAIISGMYKGETSGMFWVMMGIKVTLLTAFIIFVFPMIARKFFRTYSDSIMQFVFVMAMVFLGAGLMQFVGMEGILGAFLTGLVLNRLIPHVSPLMNRIEFVGNAIFIPYFLIGVGMIIDVNALFTGGSALKVAGIMTAVAVGSKWIGAFITQKLFKMERNERSMIFGLSSASAAATLAAVLVGHQIIMENGERLINDEVLNGTVVMILFTCIISSLATERSARRFALEEKLQFNSGKEEENELPEQILIPVANPETTEHLVNLALMIRDTKLNKPLVAVSVVTDNKNIQERKQAGLKNLENAAKIASATDVKVTQVSRYDLNICSGIVHAAEEYNATNLVIGLHWKANIIDSFFGNVTASLLKKTNREIMVARYMIPPTTVRKIHVAVPPRAEYETGFAKWIEHLGRMASQLGCKIAFYATEETLTYIKEVASKLPCRTLAMYATFDFWNEFNVISEHMDDSHLAVVVCARKGSISYDTSFERLPSTLNKHLQGSSLIVIYPEQFTQDGAAITFSDPLGHNESQHYEKAREWVTDLLRLEKEDNK
ncbi:MAG: cation:proton antiporter [Bacteroidales bacterium]|nr:cation:proton antiporter [Bacteroidales bacterium]